MMKRFEWQDSWLERLQALVEKQVRNLSSRYTIYKFINTYACVFYKALIEQVESNTTFYGDIDDNLTSDDNSNRSLNLQNPEQHNLLSHDLELSEASSISTPTMSPLLSVVSLSSESSQDDDEIQVREVRPQTTEEHSTQSEETSHEWQGFKIIGDNIDRTVRPQHQTSDSPTQSLHYFNSYAVQDCIVSSYSDTTPTINLETVSMDSLLPTEDDLRELQLCFAIHNARVLTRHLCSLSAFADVATHIKHKYSTEMAKKSNVVSRDITDHSRTPKL